MKIKLSHIGILIIIFAISIGTYFEVNSNKGAINSSTVQNDRSKKTEAEIESGSSNTDKKSISPISDNDFIIKSDNNYIELYGSRKDLKTDEEIKGYSPVNAKENYDTTFFENFTIITSPDEGVIESIDLTTPTLETPRGIKRVDSISKVIDKYGKCLDIKKYDKESKDDYGYYSYGCNDKYLYFYFDESEKITDIRFEIAG